MKIRLLSVGKPRDAHVSALHDRYAERITRLGADYTSHWVPEVKAGARFSDDEVRKREGRSLLERLDGAGRVIALDRAGTMIDSRQLADQLEGWSVPRGSFVIGGPLGLHAAVLNRADRAWSLSPLTLPHELSRLFVAEQLYRALTILRGVPYHK